MSCFSCFSSHEKKAYKRSDSGSAEQLPTTLPQTEHNVAAQPRPPAGKSHFRLSSCVCHKHCDCFQEENDCQGSLPIRTLVFNIVAFNLSLLLYFISMPFVWEIIICLYISRSS